MKYNSIKNKVSVGTGLCVLVTALAVTLYTVVIMRSTTHDNAVDRFNALVHEQSAEIETEIKGMLDAVTTLAYTLVSVKDKDILLDIDRNDVIDILRMFLEKNPKIISVFTCWEPDEFDGMDVGYGGEKGHDMTGRFAPRWQRDAAGKSEIVSILHCPIHSPNGIPGKWYDIPKKTMKEVILNPFESQVEGKYKIITTIAVPIIANGKFYGIVGIDIPLNFMQTIADDLDIYDKTGEMAVISNTGILAGVTGNPDFMGRHMKELYEYHEEKMLSIQKGEEFTVATKEYLTFFSPIKIGNTGTPWSISLSVRESKIFAETTALMREMIMIGFACTVLALIFIYHIAARILGPITKVVELADSIARGDLSTRLRIKQADEIGMLAGAIDTMAESLQGRARIADSIAQGDLSQKVVLLSDKDTLGQSFIKMINGLSVKADAAQEISEGNLKVAIEVSSEADRFGKSFQAMIDSLKGVVSQAGMIAEGDYSKDVTLRSEKDTLGNALQQMTRALRQLTETRETEDWFKKGQSQLSEQMRGDLEVVTISRNIIISLAKYLNAQIGCLYTMNSDTGKLLLTGSYAFTKRKDAAGTVEIGQGLVGQAAFEKEVISITNIPDDYIRISSSFGDAAPRNIVVQPIIYENNLVGVIELGTFDEFSDEKLRFLKEVNENIAIGLITAQSRHTTNKLLEQTQRQSEELEQQQEELQAANEELEEKTKYLEEQKNQINQKNADLEDIRIALEKKARELEISGKYKSEFLANMSHELRTPLNSLLILSQDLMDNRDGNLVKEQVESATIINKSGKDLLSLINDILDLSKIEAGKMVLNIEAVRLQEIADNIRTQFKHVFHEKDLEFSVDLGPDIPFAIQTDRQRVEQVIKNLLSNAAKFTFHGGVTVGFHRPEPGVDLSRSSLSLENAVAVSVADTGIGIPEDKKNEIFEAFQQADGSTARKFGGTGLGLSISREFSKLLGGELQVVSEPERGATFTLYLPLNLSDQVIEEKVVPLRTVAMTADFPEVTPGTIPAVRSIPDDREMLQAGDKTILVVEDDPKFSKLLLEQCHNKGFKCLSATSGEEGLELVQKYLPEAVILDIRLPGIDGWSVLDKIKENPKVRHIPVHMMSVDEVNTDAFKMGAISYLKKPLTKEQRETTFNSIEEFSKEKVRKLLVVEDNADMRESIKKLIGNGDVEFRGVGSGKSAIVELKSSKFDCMVLDIGLPDMSGIELLARLEKEKDLIIPPVIVYTARDLSREEVEELQRYSESIIIKGVKSEDRLLDETALFLHRVVNNLPKAKKNIITRLHSNDSVFKDKKVLIVDDDMRNVFALTKKFKEKEINVLKAENGSKALEILDRESDIDLVLMDVMMPVMDGYEATAKIRAQKRFSRLPIIALTAKAMKGDRDKCIEAGASDYLAKPVDLERLYSMMRVWLYKAPLF